MADGRLKKLGSLRQISRLIVDFTVQGRGRDIYNKIKLDHVGVNYLSGGYLKGFYPHRYMKVYYDIIIMYRSAAVVIAYEIPYPIDLMAGGP